VSNYPVELPHGHYHRRVIAIVEPGRVRAALEDESHCMEVTVYHDTRVTDLQTESLRIPWNSCPNAGNKLRDLIGLPLQRMHESTGHDAKLHCTHLFDLTRLAIARAKAGASVQYDIEVEDRVEHRTRAELLRDGQSLLVWNVHHRTVTGPEPFTGHSLIGAPQWPGGLDDATLEAALVFRRVFLVAQIREPRGAVARTHGPPHKLSADFLKTQGMLGRCFTYQVETGVGAESHHSWRDFSGRRENLLAHFSGTRSLADLKRVRA
jgi:Protein of unknown function (DUF2889)